MKTLRLVLGDQLDPQHSWWRRVDPDTTYVMVEARSETDYVLHHAQKVLGIFAAMRRFAELRRAEGHDVRYLALDDRENAQSIPENVRRLVRRGGYRRFEHLEPDEHRLDAELALLRAQLGVEAAVRSAEHFFDPRDGAARHFGPAKRWRMDAYYRALRKREGILLEPDGAPLGGKWSFDAENRKPWRGRPRLPTPWDDATDLTRLWATIEAAGVRTLGAPSAERFPWPLEQAAARRQLHAFLDRGLAHFGDHQDAMTTASDRLFHARISFALNTKMLSPREVIAAVVARHSADPETYPLASVEGFVRQVLGWREYVRGVYWAKMPGLGAANALGQTGALPAWYWTGETRLRCLSHAIRQSLDTAYAHHIQRLMLTGNFALLAGVRPQEVERWYLGIYIDAFEWVELPNTLGMSQYADGGFLASKPYVSAAAYVSKMSDYCPDCHYDPKDRLGERACPFNALYWDFWLRHAERFAGDPRAGFAVRQAMNLPDVEARAVRAKAAALRARLDAL